MRRLLCLAFLTAFALPASAADGHDIAVEFSQLQERIMEAQARFDARQVETRRMASLAWAGTPAPEACAYLKLSVGSGTDDGPRGRESARLIDGMLKRLLDASGMGLSALCPSVVGVSDDYNAKSITQGRSDPKSSDADEAKARTKASKIVVVDRGLILAAGSDDELAAVIGHELGHLALQHLRARQEIASMGDGAAFAQGLAAPAKDIAQRRMNWWGEGYLVETEMEADRFGAVLMARAGYDPSEFAAVLAKAELTALREDTRGEKAIRGDFDRRNAAAAKFAAEFPVVKDLSRARAVLPRLKAVLSAAR